jgi:hypothetical protein
MASDRGFLPIKPGVILITGRLDPAATLRLRAILGANKPVRGAQIPKIFGFSYLPS